MIRVQGGATCPLQFTPTVLVEISMKISQDKHSLFVRSDGCIYRPVRSVDSYTISHAVNSREDGTSAFSTETQVKGGHKSQTPFCVLRADGIEEYWHCHGMYFRKQSEDCWTPAAPSIINGPVDGNKALEKIRSLVVPLQRTRTPGM